MNSNEAFRTLAEAGMLNMLEPESVDELKIYIPVISGLRPEDRVTPPGYMRAEKQSGQVANSTPMELDQSYRV